MVKWLRIPLQLVGLLFILQQPAWAESNDLHNHPETGVVTVNPAEYVIPGSTMLDSVKFRLLLDKLDKQVYRAPENATIGDNGAIIPGKIGHRLNREKLTEQFLADVYGNGPFRFKLSFTPLYPKVDAELLAQIREKLIGQYVTYYNAGNKNRSHNISLAAKSINNYVLFPGEVFSFNKVVGQRTTNKGYLQAPVIVRGEFSEGVGGGICQVSSTLYNAADQAGLKIMQRYSHSRSVPYVPPGRDATVNWGGPDFTFKNIYNQPVLIRILASHGRLYVTLYSSDSIIHKPREVPNISQQLPEEITVETHFSSPAVLVERP